jgi:hypothetical protein
MNNSTGVRSPGNLNTHTAMTTTSTPDTVYRVAIHNQIFNSTYYVVTEWTVAKNGGWKTAGRYGCRIGMRGPGRSLGLTFAEARENGWSADMQILTAKGKVAFDLYV